MTPVLTTCSICLHYPPIQPLPTDPEEAVNLKVALFASDPIDHYFSIVREMLQEIFNGSLSDLEKAQHLTLFQEQVQKSLAPSAKLDIVKREEGMLRVHGTFKIVEVFSKLASKRYKASFMSR